MNREGASIERVGPPADKVQYKYRLLSTLKGTYSTAMTWRTTIVTNRINYDHLCLPEEHWHSREVYPLRCTLLKKNWSDFAKFYKPLQGQWWANIFLIRNTSLKNYVNYFILWKQTCSKSCIYFKMLKGCHVFNMCKADDMRRWTQENIYFYIDITKHDLAWKKSINAQKITMIIENIVFNNQRR